MLPVVLGLPLFIALAHLESSAPRTTRPVPPWTGIPASLVPALPGIALGPEPRVTGISRSASFLPRTAFADERGEVAQRGFYVHLTGLLRNTDQVVAYLDAERVGTGQARAADWSLFCECGVIPKQGGILRVWVFRAGQETIPLPPVLVQWHSL